MKKSTSHSMFYAIILFLLVACIITIPSYFTHLEASTISREDSYLSFKMQSDELMAQLESLNSALSSYEKNLNELDKRLSDLEEQSTSLNNLLINYYIEKLHDPTYVSINNEQHTYYIAAEALGQIGKPAIPLLIKKLKTPDDYERAMALYALMLASQADNVKSFCGTDYIHTDLDFDARNHPEQVKTALVWWEKYQSNF